MDDFRRIVQILRLSARRAERELGVSAAQLLGASRVRPLMFGEDPQHQAERRGVRLLPRLNSR